ncbi:hypothetical protein BaRGS_00016105, partial [Batillaria attramentaria]
MGCTPSIHVSQTGVVYCRESDDSNSPRPSAYSATTFHATHTHVVRREGSEGGPPDPSGPSTPAATTGSGKGKKKRGAGGSDPKAGQGSDAHPDRKFYSRRSITIVCLGHVGLITG